MNVALSKPLTSADGQTKLSKTITAGEGEAATSIDVLDLNLEAMTGADMEKAVRGVMQNKGEIVAVLVTDMDLHVQIASMAGGVSVADLRRLPIRDFTEVVTAVQSFLTGSV